MLPDVIDSFMLETGERNESIFYSFFVFFGKLSSGIGNLLTSLVLEYKKIDKNIALNYSKCLPTFIK